MRPWNVVYWHQDNESDIEKWLDGLTKEKLKAITKELKLLELCGNELTLPHSKSLTDGLFELRERRFGLRMYYCFSKNKIILLLCAGDKSSQNRDITTAKRRLCSIQQQKVNHENKKL